MKMMMKTIDWNMLRGLLIIDGLLIFVSATFFSMSTLLNTQIGFLSATLVIFASIKSYKHMVNTRVENEIIAMDIDKDIVDKLDDPYDLYSEDIEEEKQHFKTNSRSLSEVVKDTKPTLSIYRIGAYLLLVLGFLYLSHHDFLQLPAYLLSLGLSPLTIVVLLIYNKAVYSEDVVE
ncbi:MAG: hypothetical protein LGB07_06965 [Sulfurovum sp.]|nr:hypothetical protein [Sulfurovum sp.]MCB4745373.1 hypothetical protein [Sulfurovum sp.]MCB4747208.1 hypothetical protein [Sulfurovum sp.]MCB4750604.1 hypothetical protein [Sulfurovum sp.]MCB4753347.1 hypothetical protein [Sulfurovum sp.]